MATPSAFQQADVRSDKRLTLIFLRKESTQSAAGNHELEPLTNCLGKWEYSLNAFCEHSEARDILLLRS